MNISRYEQETIINFNEEEKTATVYTMNGRLTRKLIKLAEERPNECKFKFAEADGKAVTYIVPKRWIKINAPTKREYTEEERQAVRERFASYRQNSNT